MAQTLCTSHSSPSGLTTPSVAGESLLGQGHTFRQGQPTSMTGHLQEYRGLAPLQQLRILTQSPPRLQGSLRVS